MGKMIHATVHEKAYQVTIQAVFRKPENLSQSAFYTDETMGNLPLNSERSSTFSSTFNSDGNHPQSAIHSSFSLLLRRIRPGESESNQDEEATEETASIRQQHHGR